MRCNLTIDHGCPMLFHCKDASPPSIRHAITPMLVYQSKQSKQSTHDRILWPLACPFSSCFSSHSHGTLRAKTNRTGWRSSAAIRIALRYLYDSSVSVESCFWGTVAKTLAQIRRLFCTPNLRYHIICSDIDPLRAFRFKAACWETEGKFAGLCIY